MTRLLTTFAVLAALLVAVDSASAGNWKSTKNSYGNHYAAQFNGYQPYQNKFTQSYGVSPQTSYRLNYGTNYYRPYGYGYSNYGTNFGVGYGSNITFYSGSSFPAPATGNVYQIPGGGTISGYQNLIVLPPGATVQTFGGHCH